MISRQECEDLEHDVKDIHTILKVAKDLMRKIDERLEKYTGKLEEHRKKYPPKEDVHRGDGGGWS